MRVGTRASGDEQPVDREVPLAGVVAEGEDPALRRDVRQRLRDGGERGARRRPDEDRFLLRRANGPVVGLVLADADGAVEDRAIEVARDEAGADPLDLVRGMLA